MAKNIKPGMFINIVEGDKIEKRMVDSVNHKMDIGYYDLYTKEGTVVVNGVVAGTLAFLPHRIAQTLHKFVNRYPKLYPIGYKLFTGLVKLSGNNCGEEELNLHKHS